MKRSEKKRISVWNWMGTILVCSIPGVNIIAFILMIIFAKTASKRNYAVAGLLLCVILAVLGAAALLIFPEQIHSFAQTLRSMQV